MAILVTGVAGFIGSHVAEALLRRGDRVVGVDSFDDYYDPAIKRRNLDEITSVGELIFEQADIRDRDTMERVCHDHHVTSMIHLAARAGVRPSLAAPALYADVNVRGTAILLEIARQNRVENFVSASSSSVYGARHKGAFRETDNVDTPASPYAATKRAGELLCHSFQPANGLPITCLRFFTAYGPRQRPDMAIHLFARKISTGQPITLFGDGTTARDYTYVSDVVAGVVAALDRPRNFEIFNIGSTTPVRLIDVVHLLEAAVGRSGQIVYAPDQPGDVPYTCSDVSKAQRDLDYSPTTTLEQGLRQFVAWLEETESRGHSDNRSLTVRASV